ncbi:MAG: hypothetical protein ACI9FJ_003354, partial [Alteromonadaceae bacterium]
MTHAVALPILKKELKTSGDYSGLIALSKLLFLRDSGFVQQYTAMIKRFHVATPKSTPNSHRATVSSTPLIVLYIIAHNVYYVKLDMKTYLGCVI